MSDNYRKLTQLTPLELSQMTNELQGQKWQRAIVEQYSHREIAYLRIADNLRRKIEAHTKFEYSPVMARMPFTLSVMRRIALLLGVGPNDFGATYFSKMVAGDYVDDHIDTGAYYQEHHRIQITLKQPEATEFIVGGERITTQVGDCITFASSTKVHSIRVGDGERIVLLFDVRKNLRAPA